MHSCSAAFALTGSMLLTFFGWGLRFEEQVIAESIEALAPEFAVVVDPLRRRFERHRAELARAPLRVAPARDEAGVLEHLEVLGDSGRADVERLGQLADAGLTL